MRSIRWTLWLSALVVAAPAVGVVGQEPPRPPPQDRARMEERVREQMGRVVKERLELTDEEVAELGRVVQSFEQRRREIRRSELAVRRRIEALLLEGGADDDEAVELLGRMVDLRRQEGALFAEEQEALLEVLPAAKVLQFQVLREEMGRRIRSLRRGEGRRRPGGGRDHDGAVGGWNDDWRSGVPMPT